MLEFVNTTEPNMNENISDVLGKVNLESEEVEDSDVDLLIESTCIQLDIIRQALEVLRGHMIFNDKG